MTWRSCSATSSASPPIPKRTRPRPLFAELETLIDRFEEIAAQHGLEKIKTIGDAFMATANLLSELDEPVARRGRLRPRHGRRGAGVPAGLGGADRHRSRAGLGRDHGQVTIPLDVWGDTVNTAARIEEAGRPGTVNLSGRAWLHLRNQAQGRSLGLVDLKGKEKLEIVECVALEALMPPGAGWSR